MVILSKWRFDGITMWGKCKGHERFADGTYIHTSQVMKIELCDEGLDVYTYCGTHYRCKTEDVCLGTLENTKQCLELEKIDVSFLDNIWYE